MLTRAGEYAIRAVLFMASKPLGTVVRKKEIASSMEIPEKFLAKIANDLKRHGIIEITQGSKGGYVLLEKPGRLSLLRVVEAIDGQIFLNQCVFRPDSCKRSKECGVNKVWTKATQELRRILESVNFEDLLRSGICDVQEGTDSNQRNF